MSQQLSLLCVHGVSHAEIDSEFRPSWTEAITRAVRSYDPGLQPTIDFLEYDELFDKAPINAMNAPAWMVKSASRNAVIRLSPIE